MPMYGSKKMGGYRSKAGLENPAHAEHVEISVKHSTKMPQAAMAGSFSRKIPGPEKVGQDVAGVADMTSVKGPKGQVGKKTWSGDTRGYTNVKMPALPPRAPAGGSHQDDPRYGENSDKGPKANRY